MVGLSWLEVRDRELSSFSKIFKSSNSFRVGLTNMKRESLCVAASLASGPETVSIPTLVFFFSSLSLDDLMMTFRFSMELSLSALVINRISGCGASLDVDRRFFGLAVGLMGGDTVSPNFASRRAGRT